MKTTIFSLCFLVLLGSAAASQMDNYGLPAGGQVIEIQPIQSVKHPHRALLLWMQSPLKVPRDHPEDPIPARNTPGAAIIAAPPGSRWWIRRRKRSSIPSIFSISKATIASISRIASKNGLYYHVEGVPKGREGKPTIMWLRDYNGDGHAWEFALFDAIACMGLPTTLIGYSEAQDRVMQYPVTLTVISGNRKASRTALWVDYLFSKPPERPGFWKYAIDYRGRAGTLDAYEVRYLPKEEKFDGQLISTGEGS